MDDARAIEVIRETLPDFVAVYRFGSTVRGEQRGDSDVDIAVLAPRRLDPVERFDLQERLAIALRRDVDLVDLRRASTVMAMQVISRGEPIATGDAHERERFEDHVFGDAHVIDPALADRMMRMVGFRNVAVHDYTKPDLDVVERIVIDHLDEFLTLGAALLRSSGRV